MPKPICIVNEMGKGKTLGASNFALNYANKHENQLIYANYHLKLKNAIFSPFMFLPIDYLESLTKIENSGALIICDDFYALKTAKGLIGVIVNLSRKANIQIVITAQFMKQIPKEVRELSDIWNVDYIKDNDLLLVKVLDGKDYSEKGFKFVRHAVKNIDGLYDSREMVKFQIASEIQSEILRFSHSKTELELNISLYYNSETNREKVLKKLLPKLSKIKKVKK